MSTLLLSVPAFDVRGPLPRGTTVLEASAGTGKTFTIAALAARYVAEGHAELSQVMLVTFGREATRELRERVRERFRTTASDLADPAAARAGDDPVAALLAAGPDAEVARRRRRLTHALAHFDAATIATTHQFCRQMLDGLGVVGDTDPDAHFTEDVDDIVTEIVDDFYVRKYAAPGAGRPAFTRAEALDLGRRAAADPEARLEPADGTDETARTRHRFACGVRGELDRRKRGRRLYTYDDLLTRLHAALTDPVVGPAARARLRGRFRAVLVDEFQDTDPIQWDILRTAFHGHAALTMIGDPKQAIYAFRGADVTSYLRAARAADTRATLPVNRRSDAGLVTALDRLLARAALGDDEIVVGEVAAHHTAPRLTGAPCDSPLRLRVMSRAGVPASPRSELPLAEPMREKVADDVAADLAALLASGARVDDRPLAPGDVAVLVRTNHQGHLVRDALGAVDVPAVLAGTDSVFAAESAAQWLTLLEALEQPHRPARVRAAALTCFLGRRPAELDAEGDAVLEQDGAALRRWGAVLREQGVAAMVEVLVTGDVQGSTPIGKRSSTLESGDVPGRGLGARLLAEPDGERRLTDVRHVGQALHAAAVEGHLGLVALVEWLRRRIADAGREQGTERSRRLESDADAVQILTVHRCKGLEFPVVAVPYGWDRNLDDERPIMLHHDAAGDRVLWVGGKEAPDRRAVVEAHQAEEIGEDLRLLYVALTRARSQVIAWWAPSTTTRSSPLHRLLFGRPDLDAVPGEGWHPPPRPRVPNDAAALEGLGALRDDLIAVERVEPRDADAVPAAPAAAALAVARFDRTLDLAWRRTSYSALTALAGHGAHRPGDAGADAEPGDAVVDDEVDTVGAEDGDTPAGAVPSGDDALAVPSPMADLPTGTGFGTLVHAVLEGADLAAPDLLAELTERSAEALARRPASGLEAAPLAVALLPVLRTPLDTTGWRLCDVARGDRLSELDFELPLAGGDTPSDQGDAVDLARVAATIRRFLPAGDPLADYPAALAELGDAPLRGYLTGSIDAVLRRPDGRFVVVDYKTNWLGPSGPDGPESLTAGHYRPVALAAAMRDAHYPLQALLYAVALHRYLRWRMPGYDPERHLGGVLYLFLRGMCGPETPEDGGGRCGVFVWEPPAALVVALSDLLAGRRGERRAGEHADGGSGRR